MGNQRCGRLSYNVGRSRCDLCWAQSGNLLTRLCPKYLNPRRLEAFIFWTFQLSNQRLELHVPSLVFSLLPGLLFVPLKALASDGCQLGWILRKLIPLLFQPSLPSPFRSCLCVRVLASQIGPLSRHVTSAPPLCTAGVPFSRRILASRAATSP
jgi:hypothetical protein